MVPLRFRVVANGNDPRLGNLATADSARSARSSILDATGEGEAFNLSERGVYFRSRDKLKVGECLQMYFILPRELTGRAPEQVRCTARVVHVENEADRQGTTGVGAFVERFEPLVERRNWAN